MNKRLELALERYDLELPFGWVKAFKRGFEQHELLLDGGFLTELDVLIYLTSTYLTFDLLSEHDVVLLSDFHHKLAVLFNRSDWSFWDRLYVERDEVKFDDLSHRLDDILVARRKGIATKSQINEFNRLLDLRVLAVLAENPVSTVRELWDLGVFEKFELRDRLNVQKRLASLRKRGLTKSSKDSRVWLITDTGLDKLKAEGYAFRFREPDEYEMYIFNARPIGEINTALVLRFVRDHPGLTVRQIASEVRVFDVSTTINAWRRRMDKYFTEGLVEKSFSQFWISPDGLKFLDTFSKEELDAFLGEDDKEKEEKEGSDDSGNSSSRDWGDDFFVGFGS